jgi:hypothetical protein
VKFVAGFGRADPNAALRLHLPVAKAVAKVAA